MNQVNTTDAPAPQLTLPVNVTVLNNVLNFEYTYEGNSYTGTCFNITDYRANPSGPNVAATLLITFTMQTQGWVFTEPTIPANSVLQVQSCSSSQVSILDTGGSANCTYDFTLNYQQTSSGESYSHDPQVTNDPSVDPPNT